MLFIRSMGWVSLVASVLLLQACGFQLRGDHNLSSSLSPMAIQGLGKHAELRRELMAQLAQSNIQVTRQASEASSILRIIVNESKRRVLSVDDRAKSAEYELYEMVEFELITATQGTLVSAQKAKATRTYINTSTQVLGKGLEEKMLVRDLRRDLAGRVLSRIKAQTK